MARILNYLHLSASCGNTIQFVVPKTTLKDRFRDRVTHGTKSGPKQYLNNEEEKELAEFLKDSAAVGYRIEIMNIHSRICS